MKLRLREVRLLVKILLEEAADDWSSKIVKRDDGLFILHVTNRGQLVGKRALNAPTREEVTQAIQSIMQDVNIEDDGSVTHAEAPFPLTAPKNEPVLNLVNKKQQPQNYASNSRIHQAQHSVRS